MCCNSWNEKIATCATELSPRAVGKSFCRRCIKSMTHAPETVARYSRYSGPWENRRCCHWRYNTSRFSNNKWPPIPVMYTHRPIVNLIITACGVGILLYNKFVKAASEPCNFNEIGLLQYTGIAVFRLSFRIVVHAPVMTSSCYGALEIVAYARYYYYYYCGTVGQFLIRRISNRDV